jgi:hypothetical protein
MLDKPTKNMEKAPGWRFLQFLGFDDNRKTAADPNAKKPPKDAEERKQLRMPFGPAMLVTHSDIVAR